VRISSRKTREQAPRVDLAVKGCTAEVCFWRVTKAGWACREDLQDCHGFSVERSLGRFAVGACFSCFFLGKEQPKKGGTIQCSAGVTQP